MRGEKLKFAFYWAASCGGCEVVVLDIDEKILDIAEIADIVFWPCATDFKYADVEAMGKGEIDVCFFNGAIRNSENEEMAKLMREKSKILIALGSCSAFGGIPGMGNVADKEQIFERVYVSTPSTTNEDNIFPEPRTEVPEGELTIPEFSDNVLVLDQVVEVDYYLPGCPTNPDLIGKAVEAIKKDELPPSRSNLASLADMETVCDECDRELAEEKSVKEFKRPHEAEDNGKDCLLEQGIICMGPATIGGCGARCIEASFPCRGCFGPPSNVEDQGAKMVGLLGSIIDSEDEEEIREIIDGITDPLGTFYSYGLPKSLLQRRKLK
ncbi:oxidoreductase [candidate division MSBL1 archaeon SCGC-AAA261F17]|uniref:Oxidoreductase n=1 Tax=candidate division MSBL1 archaeon SCGC-AAA261F17 TaxID=1698274 RepID=A0A133V4I1_9EURY|nr:oxidoreductase [candidate division MSBL1 archaeon SCGC-AAA261F17]